MKWTHLSVTFGVIRTFVGISIVHIQGMQRLHNLSLVSGVLKIATASRWGPTRNIFSISFGLFQDIFSVDAIRIFPLQGRHPENFHAHLCWSHLRLFLLITLRVFRVDEYFKCFCTGWSTQNVGQSHVAINVATPPHMLTLILNKVKYAPVCL